MVLCNLQTYENTLLPRAVKQPKLGIRWSHVSFMNRIVFQTFGLEVSDTEHSFVILYPAFGLVLHGFGFLVFFFFHVLFWIWYFAQTEILLFLKC